MALVKLPMGLSYTFHIQLKLMQGIVLKILYALLEDITRKLGYCFQIIDCCDDLLD